MVVAHGNSLRALLMKICHLSQSEIQEVELPTGTPLVLEVDDRINVVRKYYL